MLSAINTAVVISALALPCTIAKAHMLSQLQVADAGAIGHLVTDSFMDPAMQGITLCFAVNSCFSASLLAGRKLRAALRSHTFASNSRLEMADVDGQNSPRRGAEA